MDDQVKRINEYKITHTSVYMCGRGTNVWLY